MKYTHNNWIMKILQYGIIGVFGLTLGLSASFADEGGVMMEANLLSFGQRTIEQDTKVSTESKGLYSFVSKQILARGNNATDRPSLLARMNEPTVILSLLHGLEQACKQQELCNQSLIVSVPTPTTPQIQTPPPSLEPTPQAEPVDSVEPETPAIETLVANDNARLLWPVTPYRGVSATYDDDEYKEYFGVEHGAIDIPAEENSPIYAAHSGEVIAMNTDTGAYYIIITDDDLNANPPIHTVYGHIRTSNVQVGDHVKEGDLIATVGGTPGTPGAGRSTGSHLHFEVYADKKRVDPMLYLSEQVLVLAQTVHSATSGPIYGSAPEAEEILSSQGPSGGREGAVNHEDKSCKAIGCS